MHTRFFKFERVIDEAVPTKSKKMNVGTKSNGSQSGAITLPYVVFENMRSVCFGAVDI
jgi:hypothetical protein